MLSDNKSVVTKAAAREILIAPNFKEARIEANPKQKQSDI